MGSSSRRAGSVRRALVSVGLGATLVLGSTGAASAGTWRHDDPTQDVVVYDEGAEDYDGDDPAPERATGDVQRFAVSHMQSKLVVRINLRQSLPRTDWEIYEHIQTPRAGFALALRRYESGSSVGLERHGEEFGRVRCSGLAITYAPRSVQVTIPSRCLGAPRWVRVGAAVHTSQPAMERYYEDDALRRGVGFRGPRLSPQIPRG